MPKTRPVKKYCHECWRDEPHVPVKCHPFLEGLAIVLTLGLALLRWPYRCTTCASVRIHSRIHWPTITGPRIGTADSEG